MNNYIRKNKNSQKNRVINLLITFNCMTLKVLRLKTTDKQALGLLAEALEINKQMLSLMKDNKISLEFIKQIFSVIVIFVKEIVSKWLRYYLAPFFSAFLNKNYAYNWTNDKIWTHG